MKDLSSNGIIGTAIFHLIIAFLLIFFGFSYPDPPPDEEGILVNFGIDETGYGFIEPAGDDQQAGENTPVEEIAEESIEEVVQEKSVPVTRPVVKETVENVQDFEEAPVKVNTPTPEEIRKKEIQKQKDIEAEKKRLEELEKKRIEDERKKQAEKLQQMGESAFGNKGVGTESGSEGITEGSGNQGTPTGQPGAENYGDGGGLGEGMSYGLGTRKVRGTLPTPILTGCTVTNRIVIRVQIDVDGEGNVVGSPKILEATYQEDCIYEAVLKAARNAKFTRSETVRQRGWIRYIIEP